MLLFMISRASLSTYQGQGVYVAVSVPHGDAWTNFKVTSSQAPLRWRTMLGERLLKRAARDDALPSHREALHTDKALGEGLQ